MVYARCSRWLLSSGASSAVAIAANIIAYPALPCLPSSCNSDFVDTLRAYSLCGSVTRSRTLVTIYATVLYILLALTLGSGVWFAYTLFTDRGDSWMSSCRVEGQNIKDAQLKSIELSSGGFDKALDGICDALLKTFRVVYIVVLVIVFLVQLCE